MSRDPNPVTNAANATLDNVVNAKLPPKLPHVHISVAPSEGRATRSHDKLVEARKIGDDVFRDPVTEILLGRIIAQIRKWHNSNR